MTDLASTEAATGAGIVTVSRPQARHAMDASMSDDLSAALDRHRAELRSWNGGDAVFETIARPEDARDGALAFTQKRRPHWQGRGMTLHWEETT